MARELARAETDAAADRTSSPPVAPPSDAMLAMTFASAACSFAAFFISFGSCERRRRSSAANAFVESDVKEGRRGADVAATDLNFETLFCLAVRTGVRTAVRTAVRTEFLTVSRVFF